MGGENGRGGGTALLGDLGDIAEGFLELIIFSSVEEWRFLAKVVLESLGITGVSHSRLPSELVGGYSWLTSL